LEIRIERSEFQLELAVVAGAAQDRAQTIAQALHGHGLILVRDQRDFRQPRIDARHLADDTDLVDHGLARLYAVLLAFVDHDLARKKVAPRVEHLGEYRALGEALPRAEQFTQMRVFSRQRRILSED